MIKYFFILVFYSMVTTPLVKPFLKNVIVVKGTGKTALTGIYTVFKDAYYETQHKRNEIVKKELMKESKGPDLEFMGQAIIVGSLLYLLTFVSDYNAEIIEFDQLKIACGKTIGSIAAGTISILVAKRKQSQSSNNENSTLKDKADLFFASFNRRLLSKKLFNL